MESVPGEVNNPTFGSRTFHPFPRLPTELRLKIWGFTTPSPRVLEIVWSGHSKWATVPQSRPEPYHALRANKEAHDNFLKNWHPFCLQKPEDGTSDPKLPTTYINPSLDTVYIGAVSRNESCFSPQAINALLLLPGIERLQNLACEIVEWNQVTMNPLKRVDRWEIGFFSRFAELENFIIVDYDIDWIWINRGHKRPQGVIELVEPTQMDANNELEMWPEIQKRFDLLRKLEEGKSLPKTVVKEIMRGNDRMSFK